MFPDMVRWILGAIAVLSLMIVWAMQPRAQECQWPQCVMPEGTSSPEAYAIRTRDRVRVGDIYNTGTDRPLQIRDNERRILGYIEADGDILDRNRRRIGTVDDE